MKKIIDFFLIGTLDDKLFRPGILLTSFDPETAKDCLSEN